MSQHTYRQLDCGWVLPLYNTVSIVLIALPSDVRTAVFVGVIGLDSLYLLVNALFKKAHYQKSFLETAKFN